MKRLLLLITTLLLSQFAASQGTHTSGGGTSSGGASTNPTTNTGEVVGKNGSQLDANLPQVACTASSAGTDKLVSTSSGFSQSVNGGSCNLIKTAGDVGASAGTVGLATTGDVQQSTYTYATGGGVANAYTVTLSPVPTLVVGSLISFLVAADNTTASTIAVNGGGLITIKKSSSSGLADLASGDLKANVIATCRYDGTVCQLQVPVANGGATLSSNTFTGNQTIGASGVMISTSGVFDNPGAMQNGAANTWFKWDSAQGAWTDAGTYAQQYFKIVPAYAPSAATNTMSNTFFEVAGTFAPSGAETVNGAGQWLGANIDPTFGNSNTTYNGAATAQIVGLQISPTINVLAASTGTYDALKINPTESSVGTGTFGSLVHAQVGGNDRMKVFSGGHIDLNQGTAPTITGTCGSSPSVIANGTDNSFRIQVGTGGTATDCTATFNKAFKAADGTTSKIPACTANSETQIIALKVAPTTSTVVITAAAGFTASSILDVHCF